MATVVGVGQASIELFGLVDRYPELDMDVQVRQFSIQGGGSVATALATLAVLGDSTKLVAAVSDDDFGNFAIEGLRSLGVDVSRVVVQPGRLSPLSFIAVEHSSQRQAVFRTSGNVDPLAAAGIDSTLLEGVQALLVDGEQVRAQVAAAELARTAGIPVVLGIVRLHEGVGDLLALADVLVVSERFATEIAPRGEIEDSLVEMAQMGPRVVVVTMGADGAVGIEGNRVVRTDTLDVDVVDTSGAGAVFRGAFVYGFIRRWPLEKTLQFANAAAGLKCRWLGGRSGLPSFDAVKQAAWGELEP